MRVPVLSPLCQPLMPTPSSRARRWLKSGKAKVIDNDLGIFTVQLVSEPSGTKTQPISVGIAISADGKQLFYCLLAGRKLYSVSVDALANEQLSDAQVAATVVKRGDKGGGSDGLESDAQKAQQEAPYSGCSSFDHRSAGRI